MDQNRKKSFIVARSLTLCKASTGVWYSYYTYLKKIMCILLQFYFLLKKTARICSLFNAKIPHRCTRNYYILVHMLGCANKDLWALCAPIFIIVVYCKTATSYFLGGKE